MEVVLVVDEGVLGVVIRRLGHGVYARYYVDGFRIESFLENGEYEEYDM